MASRTNSGGSNDLNCTLKLPHGRARNSVLTWIYSSGHAMAAPTTMHIHSLLLYCTLRHCRPITSLPMSLSTNEIGRYLDYIQKQKSAARGTVA